MCARWSTALAVLCLHGSLMAQPDAGLLWHSAAPGNLNGALHGVTREADGLRFAGDSSYVDLGTDARLKTAGDCSFAAWIRLEAQPFPNPTTNWTLFTWETYKQSGTICRLDGRTAQVYVRTSQANGGCQQGFSEAALANRTFYHVAVVKQGPEVAFFIDGKRDSAFSVHHPDPNDLPFNLGAPSQPFCGTMQDVRLYGRALSAGDVVALYAAGGAAHGKDVSWVGKLKLTPFIHRDLNEVTIEADARGALPLQPGERIRIALQQPGREPVQVLEREASPASGCEDLTFDLGKLPAGAYEVRVAIVGADKPRAEASVSFHHPAPPPAPPDPAAWQAPPLPPPIKPPAYRLRVHSGGGFSVMIGQHTYPVESSFSSPHAGDNRLVAAAQPDRTGEAAWSVSVSKSADGRHRIVATGQHYRLTRELIPQPSRVLVRDRIENLAQGELGVAIDNRVDLRDQTGVEGVALAAPVPPVFVRATDHGVGLVPLNDLYQLLQRTYVEPEGCGARIAGLGLPRGGSHDLEWAVYPVGTDDYYELINAIRRDEGLNGRTIDGCLAISHSGRWLRDDIPAEDLVRHGGLKYLTRGCLMKVADDPEIAFEGIEYVRYPKERAALRDYYARVRQRYPGLQLGFHVAYNIYATNTPDQLFPDSRMLTASGKHDMYGSFEGYFSEARRAQGWGWYPYYPTLTNSFGRELLQSVDVMMDEIGVETVWADGLLSGYGATSGNFPTAFVSTSEPWDGYSVELDPTTRTISRKWGQKVALGREVLLAYIRRINDRGGRVWINHMNIVPRSFARENAYWAAETNDGDHRCASLHLAPAPHGLAQPNKSAKERDVYDDIRGKLSYGTLYAYYHWSCSYTHPALTTVMYPLTIEEIRAGAIKGRERLITLHPGVYGWPGDRDLHFAYRADGRGYLVEPGFVTTVDKAGVRTEVKLQDRETAVLKRIPVTLTAGQPVNVVVEQYDATGLRLACHGRGEATITVRHGDFAVKPNAGYSVTAGRAFTVRSDRQGNLSFKVPLAGLTRLSVTPAP